MADFVDARLELGIDYGQMGGPEYRTTIEETASREARNSDWPAPRYRADLGARNIQRSELDTLLAFFRARRGRAVGFRLKDWQDYAVTAQALGVGQAAQATVQLVKTYSDGLVTTTRTIKKPVAGSVTVYLDGSPDAGSLDASTGVYTFSAPLAGGEVITADIEFDVPVRFATDQFRAEFQAHDPDTGQSIFYLESLPVVEDPNA